MIELCDSENIIEEGCREFTVNSVSIFVLRKYGKLYAYRNSCPHLGIPLNWQPDTFLDSDNELIQCSSHSALFIIESGECIYGPCKGSALTAINIWEQDKKVFLEAIES